MGKPIIFFFLKDLNAVFTHTYLHIEIVGYRKEHSGIRKSSLSKLGLIW